MIEIDKIDRKILVELEFNARMQLTMLGKKIRLSPQRIKYRLDNLVNKGVIRQFVPLINVANLGYEYYRIYFRYEDVNEDKEQEIIEYFVNHDNVYWVVSMMGRWDLQILILARNMLHFHKLYNEIIEKFGNHLRQNVTSVSITNYHQRRTYLLNKNSEMQYSYGGEPIIKKIDKIDKKIIEKLNQNARMSIVDIAHSAGLTPKAVIYRIKRLEKENIIQTYRAWLDIIGMGYQYYKILATLRVINKQIENKILSFCRMQKYVTYIITCVWPWNLELEIECENEQQFLEVMKDFKIMFGNLILDQEVVKIYKEHKLKYLPSVNIID